MLKMQAKYLTTDCLSVISMSGFLMIQLNRILSSLTPNHRAALQWFAVRRGIEVDWPAPLSDGTFLVNRAKGIHKPAGWQHALSIRQALISPYPDEEPAIVSNGTWRYRYFQEGNDPLHQDHYFTNRGLMPCLADGVPVGVLRQIKKKPSPRYQVMGLAKVLSWEHGFFVFEGINDI